VPDPHADMSVQQRDLRRKLLAVETTIARELNGLEAEIGLEITRVDLGRFSTGYKPILHIGDPVRRGGERG